MAPENYTQMPAAWLVRAAHFRPAAEAIHWDGGSLSYRRLQARSEALARSLGQQTPPGATLVIRLGSRRQTDNFGRAIASMVFGGIRVAE